MIKYLFVMAAVLTVLGLSGCNHKTDADKRLTADDSLNMTILKIQDCARLYTSEIRIHKIVLFDDVSRLKGSFFSKQFDIKLPLGNRKVAIPMDATLKAWVDFSSFSKDNIQIDSTGTQRKLTVVLPDPQIVITASKVDHAGTKEYVSWLRSNFTDAELTSFTRQGMKEIEASIPEKDIESACRLHAAQVLIPLFAQMGFREENITLIFKKEVKDPHSPVLNKIID